LWRKRERENEWEGDKMTNRNQQEKDICLFISFRHCFFKSFLSNQRRCDWGNSSTEHFFVFENHVDQGNNYCNDHYTWTKQKRCPTWKFKVDPCLKSRIKNKIINRIFILVMCYCFVFVKYTPEKTVMWMEMRCRTEREQSLTEIWHLLVMVSVLWIVHNSEERLLGPEKTNSGYNPNPKCVRAVGYCVLWIISQEKKMIRDARSGSDSFTCRYYHFLRH
jgi:hypothetical protein